MAVAASPQVRWPQSARAEAAGDDLTGFGLSEMPRSAWLNEQASGGNQLTDSPSLNLGVSWRRSLENKEEYPWRLICPGGYSKKADDLTFDPASIADGRERIMRAICIRRRQPAFRAALLDAYDGRCAVTGCDVEDILEAAHISPYGGPSTNHLCNGLLLRADIHTLFDCSLLSFHPKTRQVLLAGKLKGSDHGHLAGGVLREPKDAAYRPSQLSLAQRLAEFETRSGQSSFENEHHA